MEILEISVVAFEDLIDRVASFESFRIADRVYSAEFLIPQLTVDASDLASEIASASAFAFYWGQEACRARRFKAQMEASYRTWRDRTWLELKASPTAETNKFPTDAQCEKMLHQASTYGTWRGRLDDAQESAEMAESLYEAFRMKVDLIKVMQKHLENEAGGAPYSVVVDNRQTPARSPQVAAQNEQGEDGDE